MRAYSGGSQGKVQHYVLSVTNSNNGVAARSECEHARRRRGMLLLFTQTNAFLPLLSLRPMSTTPNSGPECAFV